LLCNNFHEESIKKNVWGSGKGKLKSAYSFLRNNQSKNMRTFGIDPKW